MEEDQESAGRLSIIAGIPHLHCHPMLKPISATKSNSEEFTASDVLVTDYKLFSTEVLSEELNRR